MNDRLGDEQIGAMLGASIARQATSISARPNDEVLFARVGARAARQRRMLAAAAIVAVTVASITGYAIGTTNRDGDAGSVQTPVAGPDDPDTVVAPAPAPGDAAYDGPLEHVFTRTANGIEVRVYTSPPAEEGAAPGFVVAELSSDGAVGIGRVQHCPGTTVIASGTFGGPEGSPVAWAITQSPDEPGAADMSVRAVFGGTEDTMVPVRGIAVLVAPGSVSGVLLEGPFGGGGQPIGGEVFGVSNGMCMPPPTPATLPPAGSQPADVAAAEAGVRQAYVDVYDNYQPSETEAHVRQALRTNGFTDEQLAAMTVEVGEVRFIDETHAAVLFRLTVPGHSDGTQEWRLGYAVLEDGRWTQAPETRCDNLRGIGVDCP